MDKEPMGLEGSTAIAAQSLIARLNLDIEQYEGLLRSSLGPKARKMFEHLLARARSELEVIEGLMEQILECGKSGDIVHQLLHAHAGFNDHLAGRTIDRGVDDRFYIIEGRRLPGLYGQSGSRKSCCGIQSWDTSRRRRRIFGALGWQWLLLNPVDQPTDLPGHWVLRRLLQESVQSLDAFVSF